MSQFAITFFRFFFFCFLNPFVVNAEKVDQSKNETFCLLSRLSFHEIFINFDCYANVIAHLIPHKNDIEKKPSVLYIKIV